MNTLAQRLHTAHEAGVRRLECPPDELRRAAAEAGCVFFEANLLGVHDKNEFMLAVAAAIRAPEWFGANWDALADALGDLSWRPAPGYVLLLQNGGENFGMTEEEHKTALEIFSGASVYWKMLQKPFWVFFD
jgi:hypothetical protein